MSEKITELTREQEALLEVWKEEGFKTGSCTDPCNREDIEDAVTEVYQMLNKPKPRFIWVDSPLGANVIINAMKRGGKWSDTRIKEYLSDLDAAVKADSSTVHWPWSYGQSETYWVAFYTFMRNLKKDIYKPEDDRKLSLWERLIKGGWIWSFEKATIISERPDVIKWDEDKRVHCDDGPAIHFRDGWSVYEVHGVIVPSFVIEDPSRITVEMIQKESNAEVSRIMREKYGEGRYLRDINAKVIDLDIVPADTVSGSGSIMRSLFEDDKGWKWLVGSDGGTGRVYYMRAPDDSRTCRDAYKALANGLDEKDCIAQG